MSSRLQRTFDGDADVGRAAVHTVPSGVGHEPELGADHDLVATTLEGAADEFFVDERAVDLGGVDERHAEVESAVDRADRLGVVAAGAGVGGGHAHGAETDTGDLEISKLDVLHDVLRS